MTISERLVERTKQLRTAKDEIKRLKLDVKQRNDMISALTNENEELSTMNEALRNRFINGGVVYTINDGYVSSAVAIPPYSEWTYDQPIHEAIGTPLYNTYKFIKIDNRQLEIDKIKYKIYLGGM